MAKQYTEDVYEAMGHVILNNTGGERGSTHTAFGIVRASWRTQTASRYSAFQKVCGELAENDAKMHRVLLYLASKQEERVEIIGELGKKNKFTPAQVDLFVSVGDRLHGLKDRQERKKAKTDDSAAAAAGAVPASHTIDELLNEMIHQDLVALGNKIDGLKATFHGLIQYCAPPLTPALVVQHCAPPLTPVHQNYAPLPPPGHST